jgi:hypothetical protein
VNLQATNAVTVTSGNAFVPKDVAVRLRRQTIMTLEWIAGRLRMGIWTHVSNCAWEDKAMKVSKVRTDTFVGRLTRLRLMARKLIVGS